jgi:hypothetical protein
MEKQAFKLRSDIVYATEEALLSEIICYSASRGGTLGEQQRSLYQGGGQASIGSTISAGSLSPNTKKTPYSPSKNNRRGAGGGSAIGGTIAAADYDDVDD